MGGSIGYRRALNTVMSTPASTGEGLDGVASNR
jgi:hypothetical protein